MPDSVPLPELDDRVISREIAVDDARVEGAKHAPLSPEVRSLGSALRAFNTAEAQEAKDIDMSDARAAIDRARAEVLGKGKDEELRALRAVQMLSFLAEVKRFEHSGEISPELEAVGGTFIRRMRRIGWCEGNRVVLTDVERRAAFKSTWNKTIDIDRNEAFALSNQETRALYVLYFTHPHAPEAQRSALTVARLQAKDQATCARIDEGEHSAAQAWLITKLAEYAAIDPSYPLDLARGVAFYRRRQYADAARSFSQWIEGHPDGPWALRARNYLRASTLAEEETF